jgi:hypothetical protein
MSLLVRAALLGALAYVVSRAVRKSQQSIDASGAEGRRLARNADADQDEQWSTDQQPSTTHI